MVRKVNGEALDVSLQGACSMADVRQRVAVALDIHEREYVQVKLLNGAREVGDEVALDTLDVDAGLLAVLNRLVPDWYPRLTYMHQDREVLRIMGTAREWHAPAEQCRRTATLERKHRRTGSARQPGVPAQRAPAAPDPFADIPQGSARGRVTHGPKDIGRDDDFVAEFTDGSTQNVGRAVYEQAVREWSWREVARNGLLWAHPPEKPVESGDWYDIFTAEKVRKGAAISAGAITGFLAGFAIDSPPPDVDGEGDFGNSFQVGYVVGLTAWGVYQVARLVTKQ